MLQFKLPLEPGTIVLLYTDHFPGSRYQIGIIEYYEIGTTYMLDLITRYGLPVWDHQWFTESEMAPAGTSLGDIYEHIANMHHEHTWSSMNGYSSSQTADRISAIEATMSPRGSARIAEFEAFISQQ